MSADLVLGHLYPDLLRTYGDRGNVLTLQRRAEWRGFSVEVAGISRGERIRPETGLLFLGGGTDRAQSVLATDLAGRGPEIGELLSRGTVVIGVCGGYQFLGHRYVDLDGTEIPGLGLLDVSTTARPGRLIGPVHARGILWDHRFDLVGFENHGGRTTLGSGCRPLATVVKGHGNDGVDGSEGAAQGNVVGTYLHGPVLPSNPDLADALLQRALADRLHGEPLAPLDDHLEREAQRRTLAR